MIFDETFRRRLETLKRLVARALAGRGGSGRSPFRERGGRVEFAGHRGYAPGDDAGAVDWAAYARLEALVVKEFEAPKEAQLLLLLDRSGSMRLLGKEEAALRIAAALGWLGLAAGARVAVVSRDGGGRPVEGAERFPEILEAMEKIPPSSSADLDVAAARVRAAGGGRRTAVLLSDLYEAEAAARAISRLRGRFGQVVCLHVVAEEELTPPPGARALLRDAETGEEIALDLTAEARAGFIRAADRFLRERQALCARHGARYVRVSPADDLLEAVGRALP
jgi:uncharacterized protein (DUF58 family)